MILDVADGLSLPVDFATDTCALIAKRRAGKSNAAVVMAEAMYDAGLPWVAVDPKSDWYGVRSSGDGNGPGLSVPVLGGEHGDIPLEPTAGAFVADLVAKERLTCVLDVSEFSKREQIRFLTAFAQRLLKVNRDPLHLFLEEVDEYIPQRVMGEEAPLVGAFSKLVRRGGFRGIGCTMITQRSAVVNKDVLSQASSLIVLQTTAPLDQKAVEAWLKYHAQSTEILASLASLAPGEAWVISPSLVGEPRRVQFHRRRTFDSGSTPKVGQTRVEPKRLADVDLAAIKEAMSETIERAKESDPKELRKRIASLEKELRVAQHATAEPEVIVERVEVPVLSKELVQELRDALEPAGYLLQEVRERLESQPYEMSRTGPFERQPFGESSTGPHERQPHARSSTGIVERQPSQASRTVRDEQQPRRVSSTARPEHSDLKLDRSQRAILTVLASHGPRTHAQLALQTGYSPKASTIGVALSKLRQMGLVEHGQPIRATQEGLEAAEYEPLPTGDELIDFWRNKFGRNSSERKVFDVLVESYPDEVRLEEMCERTGYSPTASTVGVAMSKLRKLELVEGWAASSQFMNVANR